MSYQNELMPLRQELTAQRPAVTTYDSCFEHSVEHWIELRRMVELQNEDDVVTAEQEEFFFSASA